MTIEDKRGWLLTYCHAHTCNDKCPLASHRSGFCRDMTITKTGDINKWTDEELDSAIRIIRSSEPNNVDHPTHYNNGKIECIDAMESAFGKEAVKHFCICNAFKYIWRAEHKNGVEDIDKTIWYLNKYKELSDVHE